VERDDISMAGKDDDLFKVIDKAITYLKIIVVMLEELKENKNTEINI